MAIPLTIGTLPTWSFRISISNKRYELKTVEIGTRKSRLIAPWRWGRKLLPHETPKKPPLGACSSPPPGSFPRVCPTWIYSEAFICSRSLLCWATVFCNGLIVGNYPASANIWWFRSVEHLAITKLSTWQGRSIVCQARVSKDSLISTRAKWCVTLHERFRKLQDAMQDRSQSPFPHNCGCQKLYLNVKIALEIRLF